MKFQLVVERTKNDSKKFSLLLENLSTHEARYGRVLLATGTSMMFLKTRASSIINKPVQWCNGDDPNYDSTEYFEL